MRSVAKVKIYKKRTAFLVTLIFAVVLFENCQASSQMNHDSAGPNFSAGSDKTTKKLSQYGITWTFAEPLKFGTFINGDFWVVGPAHIISIEPSPEGGRNGSTIDLNVSGKYYTSGKACWDDRIAAKRYDPSNLVSLPVTLKAGQALVSTISIDQLGTLTKMLRGGRTNIPIRTAAVLTCLAKPVPEAPVGGDGWPLRPKVLWQWKITMVAVAILAKNFKFFILLYKK